MINEVITYLKEHPEAFVKKHNKVIEHKYDNITIYPNFITVFGYIYFLTFWQWVKIWWYGRQVIYES